MTATEVDWNAVDVVLLAVSTPNINDKIVLDYIEAAALDVGRGLSHNDRRSDHADPGARLWQARWR
jgi:hypothetical protein